jgi:hypothetical protein
VAIYRIFPSLPGNQLVKFGFRISLFPLINTLLQLGAAWRSTESNRFNGFQAYLQSCSVRHYENNEAQEFFEQLTWPGSIENVTAAQALTLPPVLSRLPHRDRCLSCPTAYALVTRLEIPGTITNQIPNMD